MPLADLLGALERHAADEASAIAAAADADVARIDAASARACSDCLADAIRIATDEARALAGAQLAEAEQRRRRSVLEARAAMLDRIRAALAGELPSLVDPALRERLAAAALTYGEGTVRQVPSGVVIERADGMRIDATLEALLDQQWPRLAAEALALVERP
jgi:vacuolar-type H+-ATPase subunit E/Vma4